MFFLNKDIHSSTPQWVDPGAYPMDSRKPCCRFQRKCWRRRAGFPPKNAVCQFLEGLFRKGFQTKGVNGEECVFVDCKFLAFYFFEKSQADFGIRKTSDFREAQSTWEWFVLPPLFVVNFLQVRSQFLGKKSLNYWLVNLLERWVL